MPVPGPDRQQRPEAGPAVSFDELVARHAAELLGLAYSMLGNVVDAEDVVQETFLGAFRGIEGFERRASERTWLTAILVRQVARRRRTIARARVVPLTTDVATAASSAAASDARSEAAAALGSLSPEHRDVLVLREVRGLSYDEIAAALQIPRGTVESRLHRARQTLRERFTRSREAGQDGSHPARAPERRPHGRV